MSGIRVVFGLFNVGAAYLMFHSASVKTSSMINGVLALVMTSVFLVVMGIGVSGMVLKVAPWKLSFVIIGTVLIVIGSR